MDKRRWSRKAPVYVKSYNALGTLMDLWMLLLYLSNDPCLAGIFTEMDVSKTLSNGCEIVMIMMRSLSSLLLNG